MQQEPEGATRHAVPLGTAHLLTLRDVASLLRVSTATVYGLVKRGRLPHVRVSNAIRVAQGDLEAALLKLKVPSAAPRRRRNPR